MRHWISLLENALQTPAEALLAAFSSTEGVVFDAEPFSDREVYISWFERARDAYPGSGAAYMKRLCSEADRLGVSLELRVADVDEQEPDTFLISYYEHFGFTTTRHDAQDGTFMRREAVTIN